MPSTTNQKSAGEARIVELAQIAVAEDENPRGRVEEASLRELASSIRQHGVLQPILVEPHEGGYRLIAGYRRLRAAKDAGLTEIPALVREASGHERLTYALSENLPGLREDVDPVSEARAMLRLANAESLTQKRLARRLGTSEAFVRERLRLCRLPVPVQERIAAGRVPTTAAARLEEIAKVSERLAVEVAEAIVEARFDAQTLGERPGEAIRCVLAPYEQREEAPGPGDLPATDVGSGVDLERELPAVAERRAELTARLAEAREPGSWRGTRVELREADIDALRALGVLVEYPSEHEWGPPYRFCTDAEALADRVELAIEAERKRAAKQIREREREAKALAEASGVDASELSPEEVERERRRAEREERQAEQEGARAANLELGRNLLRRRGRKVSAKRQLARAKALARLVAHGEEGLAAALRLTRETWQEVEVVSFKNGNSREKITHLEAHQTQERLLAEIDRAASIEELLDLVAEAVVAATYASEAELPQSRRFWRAGLSRHDGEIDAAIEAEAKGVLPEALRPAGERRAPRGRA